MSNGGHGYVSMTIAALLKDFNQDFCVVHTNGRLRNDGKRNLNSLRNKVICKKAQCQHYIIRIHEGTNFKSNRIKKCW